MRNHVNDNGNDKLPTGFEALEIPESTLQRFQERFKESVRSLAERRQELTARAEFMHRVNEAWRQAKGPLPSDTNGWRGIAKALDLPLLELEGVRKMFAEEISKRPPFTHQLAVNRLAIVRLDNERQKLVA